VPTSAFSSSLVEDAVYPAVVGDDDSSELVGVDVDGLSEVLKTFKLEDGLKM
jgi:hypothetical protein